MTRSFDRVDMLFHMLIDGGTGSGKTYSVLYMLSLLLRKQDDIPVALFLFDPAGDAAIDLMRTIPKSEWRRVVMLDPQYVAFCFNPFSLPKEVEDEDRPEVLQRIVDEFSALLADVFNTDATNAPRLMWIFKGGLYYLYTFTDNPTFWDLYNIMLYFMNNREKQHEIEELLRGRGLQDEIITGTMEAISKLPPDAYLPVINRISNFILPPDSMTFRTFCSRESKVDLEELMEPGRLTIFRIPSGLPSEFRKLLASALVMKLYFVALKRARRLERLGKTPAARTPVILAADEFRDVSNLRLLPTILSQSRKFGLYLWMVSQTLSELPDDLIASVQANVGSVLAFRSSPDDAKKLSKLLHPQKPGSVEPLIPGLEDYAALVRKRPVGGRPFEPPFRVTFPKLTDPIHRFSEIIQFMKTEMRRRYGGAVGDKRVVFWDQIEEVKRKRGECYVGGPLYWTPLPYLHFNGPEVPFKYLSDRFEDLYGWSRKSIQNALNRLVTNGRVSERAYGGQLFMGIDPETRQPMWKEPETKDEERRATDVYYSLTSTAREEFFEVRVASPRGGRPLHVLAMKTLLEQYWRKGRWCTFDQGEQGKGVPDIVVTEPIVVHVKGKEGQPTSYWDPDKWDEGNRTAVEVETSPSKNLAQLRENYERDVWTGKYRKVRFVVFTRTQVAEVRKILQDKDRGTFEVVHLDLGLREGEVERLLREEAELPIEVEDAGEGETAEGSAKPEGVGEHGEETATAPPQKNELWVLAKITLSGYGGRAVLASGLGTAERQVSRYLRSLEGKGRLERKGNGYQATAKGAELVAQAGLTSATLPARPGDLKVDMASLSVGQG